MHSPAKLVPYELERLENIKRKDAKLAELRLQQLGGAIGSAKAKAPAARKPGAAFNRATATAAPAGYEPRVTRNAGAERAQPPARRKAKQQRRTKKMRAQLGGYAAARDADERRRAEEREERRYRVAPDDDGYGGVVGCESGDEGGDDEEGGEEAPHETAVRYAHEAEQAAVRDRAQRSRAAQAGASYFCSRGRAAGSKALLADLPLADEYTIQSLLEQLPCGHAEAREALRARALNELYPRWTALLQAGFSVLVYGVGSKKQLLEEFQHHLGLDGAVVVVNGWHPTLRAKHILAACLAAVAPSDAALRGRGCGELLAALQAVLPCVRSGHQRRLYLLLNNIDGQQLRGGEAQGMLADLAAVPNVHLVASADSVNFPLLWNKRNAARMRWAWEHAPTYAPYTAETEVVARALTGRGEERLLRGASHVLLSLTPNARTVFRLLAEAQLQNSDIGGLTFAQWYALCRAQLSVASEDALRIHLGEFLDHNLVKKLRRSDGVELLAIQFSADDLKQILEDVGGPAH